ncbi:hypothetical protein DICPUDRAFT_147744 [Dictyostelium purpureum]|uniref:Uncharacterized protein n=1 Tax=Dictyostelium purpureum TaxID=5786 RepID=F0Z9A4_DICPU|nr:uncharacterized protein DICPUDRAFT_147744 [Dictyostelium purpureum]EGC39436.1 hypothetical protein DICPUDRAFT_147744 [Dictyostelium purpureum]|eukprot:XP_003283994.1 hypothetical protein DICPUDRAFT_147744 [Dictyostelium purpureum]
MVFDNTNINTENENNSEFNKSNPHIVISSFIEHIDIDRNDEEYNEDFKGSLVLFIFGFFILITWIINIKYLNSENNKAKILSRVSLVLFLTLISIVSIITWAYGN